MNRKQLLGAAAAAAAMTPLLSSVGRATGADALPIPKNGQIVVAFIITEGANVMDLAGPWETFQDVVLPDGSGPFRLVTVSDTTQPVTMTGGMRITPSFSFHTMPHADAIVMGAQGGHSDAMMKFIRDGSARGALVMSVCTGAFKLAMTGLLDGKRATTHHEFYEKFAAQFPKVQLVRGERFIDDGTIVTAGGLTSGIEGALHVVRRYFGEPASRNVARYMEFVPTERAE